MNSRLKRRSQDDDDARTLWHRMQAAFRSNMHLLTRSALSLVLLLTLLHVAYPPSIEWLNALGHLPEPSLATILALMVTIVILEKVFAIEDELVDNRKLIFAPQDDLYRKVIDQLLSNHIAAAKVLFLQHSGQTASADICKLARSARETDIVLYQQAPNCTALDACGNIVDRIKSVNDHLAFMDGASAFRSNVKIRRFLSPASIRAMVVDDKIIVLSWYLYLKTGTGLKIIGSENTGLYITSDAPEFNDIHEMICRSIGVYDGGCVEREEKLSANVTLQHC